MFIEAGQNKIVAHPRIIPQCGTIWRVLSLIFGQKIIVPLTHKLSKYDSFFRKVLKNRVAKDFLCASPSKIT